MKKKDKGVEKLQLLRSWGMELLKINVVISKPSGLLNS